EKWDPRGARRTPEPSVGAYTFAAPDPGTQVLGRLEDRDGARGDLHRFAGPRVPGEARLAASDLEGAEAADLDVLAFRQGVLHGAQESIDHQSAVFLRDARADRVSDLLDEVRLRHFLPPRGSGGFRACGRNERPR